MKLSKEAIAVLEHFFWCFPPKYFSRNIRDAVIQLLERFPEGSPLYQTELLAQLTVFLPVLDQIEDEGAFDSEDYERNWGIGDAGLNNNVLPIS